MMFSVIYKEPQQILNSSNLDHRLQTCYIYQVARKFRQQLDWKE